MALELYEDENGNRFKATAEYAKANGLKPVKTASAPNKKRTTTSKKTTRKKK